MTTFNNFPRSSDPAPSDLSIHLPNACPTCRSALIVTTSKNPDVTSYWRCRECGEIWNVARRHDHTGAGRWR